jgi:hypothetical protein
MKFSKEAWWEYVRGTELKDMEDGDILIALQQAFYSGYICKESEIKIIDSQLVALKEMFK